MAYRFEPLHVGHDRDGFRCGVATLDAYLQRQAGQDRDRGTAATFCLTPDGIRIDGFYTLSALSILGAELPAKLTKRLPSRSPIGVTLLGRMAVREELKGQRLGELLLMDALRRAWLASQEVASWAVVVDAKEGVEVFYLRYGFIAFAEQSRRMFLPMGTIAKLFA